MPIDDWLIFAYIMLFTSIILCGIFPLIYRLMHARRVFHRYDIEFQLIESSCPYALLTSQSIYTDVQLDVSDIQQQYSDIPYIDDDISV